MNAIETALFHYTTLSGLQGIVESKALWASDIRYLNYFLEVKNAQDWFKHLIPELKNRYRGSPHLRDVLKVTNRVIAD
jgi:hypothetical protein